VHEEKKDNVCLATQLIVQVGIPGDVCGQKLTCHCFWWKL